MQTNATSKGFDIGRKSLGKLIARLYFAVLPMEQVGRRGSKMTSVPRVAAGTRHSEPKSDVEDIAI